LRVLFVGRLTLEKNVHILLKSLELLKDQEIKIECRIIGDGPMRNTLEQLAETTGLNAEEVLIGGLPFEGVLEYYEWADVLVLASETEGWPKAIAEAMTFGLVCIGTNRGLVPQMLADGRGLLVEPGDEIALASALQNVAVGNIDFISMSQKASRWAQRYSLDGLREAIRDMLIREWHLTDDALRKIP
jgi:glycosyltransferase involved in cell wall biosynthesis